MAVQQQPLYLHRREPHAAFNLKEESNKTHK
jgi:hypothetical protein